MLQNKMYLHCYLPLLFSIQGWGSDYISFYNIMQIFIPTVKLLTDAQLKELGIETMGDMALFRRQCHESEQSKYTLMYIVMEAFFIN